MGPPEGTSAIALAGAVNGVISSEVAAVVGEISISTSSRPDGARLLVMTAIHSTERFGVPVRWTFEDAGGPPGLHASSVFRSLPLLSGDVHQRVGIVREIGVAGEAAIGRHPCSRSASVLSTGVCFSAEDPERICYYAELSVLGHDLVSRPTSVFGPSRRVISKALEDLLSSHATRSRTLDWRRPGAGRGWCEETVLLACSGAGLALEAILVRLDREGRVLLRTGDGESAVIAWREGVVRCDFVDRERNVTLQDHRLTFVGAPHGGELVAAIGRPVSAAVSHPLVPRDAIVADASASDGRVELHLMIPLVPLSLEEI